MAVGKETFYAAFHPTLASNLQRQAKAVHDLRADVFKTTAGAAIQIGVRAIYCVSAGVVAGSFGCSYASKVKWKL